MKRSKNIIAAITGTTLGTYDNSLYIFFAIVLVPIFFPHEEPLVAHMATFTALAAGFIARPLGGLFFSHMGDRLGRKKALVLSIFLITVPTLVIGLLPPYVSIGIAAPIILIICRLMHGFCIGGELGGAMTFVVEHAPPHRKGLYASFIAVSSYLGAILGASVGALCLQPFMPSWGWRIPFLVGGMIGLLGYTLRRYINETAAFMKLQKRGQTLKYPLKDAVKHYKINMLRAMGVAAGVLVPFFIVTTYLNGVLKTELHFTSLDIMKLNIGLMIFWTGLSPLMGLFADRIGIPDLMKAASGTLVIVSYPLFVFLENKLHSFGAILFVQVCLSILGVAFAAPCPAYLSSLFPTKERYSGISLGYTVGSALLGGTTPLIATALLQWTGDQKAPAYYLLACAVGAFCSVLSSFSDSRVRSFLPSKMRVSL